MPSPVTFLLHIGPSPSHADVIRRGGAALMVARVARREATITRFLDVTSP